jgi:hypothetical protein
MKRRSSVASIAIHGALAGALGAATMTVLRMLAHRAGWIDAMVPQAVEVWAKDKAGFPLPRRAESHHVADQLLHLGYGATAGAAYGIAHAQAGAAAQPSRAIALGSALWLLGSCVLFPALKIAPPPWRSSPRAELVNVAAHLLYGSAVVYLLEEFERQTFTQPRKLSLVQHAAVG